MAKTKNKHKSLGQGKPRGATYADVLARKRAVQAGLEKFASDTALQIEADTRTQRAMWLMVCSIADAFKIGPERMNRDFFPALQANTDELEKMKAEADEDYAYDKLRKRAEQVTGMKIQYMYEQEMRAAGLKLSDDGEYVPITRGDKFREMTDEELADKLYHLFQITTDEQKFGDISTYWCDGKAGCINEHGEIDCDEQKHKACIIRWLREPAEGGADDGEV